MACREVLQVEHHFFGTPSRHATFNNPAIARTVTHSGLGATLVLGQEIHAILIRITVRSLQDIAVLLDLIPVGYLVRIGILAGRVIIRDRLGLSLQLKGDDRLGDPRLVFLARAIDQPLRKFVPIRLQRRIGRGDARADGHVDIPRNNAARHARFGVTDKRRIKGQCQFLTTAAGNATFDHRSSIRAVRDPRLRAARIFIRQ